jgi:hypothetical protein
VTRLVRIQLGSAPDGGTLGLNQTGAFRRQLLSVLSAVEGAWLVIVNDLGSIRVEAVWATLAERRNGRER